MLSCKDYTKKQQYYVTCAFCPLCLIYWQVENAVRFLPPITTSSSPTHCFLSANSFFFHTVCNTQSLTAHNLYSFTLLTYLMKCLFASFLYHHHLSVFISFCHLLYCSLLIMAEEGQRSPSFCSVLPFLRTVFFQYLCNGNPWDAFVYLLWTRQQRHITLHQCVISV